MALVGGMEGVSVGGLEKVSVKGGNTVIRGVRINRGPPGRYDRSEGVCLGWVGGAGAV